MIVLRTELPGIFPLLSSGKVREMFDLGNDYLLIVTSDRISAFDVMMNQGIPGKGHVLNQISAIWFRFIKKHLSYLSTHFVTAEWSEIIEICPRLIPHREMLDGRSMIVHKADRVFGIEAIVRGYLYGSVKNEYKEHGTVGGIQMPPGLVLASRLPQAVLTPSTKAELGKHDENITYEEMVHRQLVTADEAQAIKAASLAIFSKAHAALEELGIILADTKFEWGLINGELALLDEALTPDSSRIWPKITYKPGQDQPSYDKQFVRDYLEGLVQAGQWNKQAPPPDLPAEIIAQTADRYDMALRVINEIAA